jgi:septal ring factor EnvC (AmiA/AmiB activator)
MTHLDRERIQAHQRTLEALAKERVTLQARVKQLQSLEDQGSRARAALDRAVQNRTALVTSIDQRRDLNAQWTGELQAAQQRLQVSIAQLDDTSLPFRPFKGALPWPARGQISSRFGRQTSSRFGTSIVRNGVEIARPNRSRSGPSTKAWSRLRISSPATETS